MTEHAVEFRPVESRFYERIGFGAVLAVVGGIAFWSIAAPIEGAVIAGGQVVVESNRKIVQHLEGGVIGSIAVREGDLVREGDIVARFDDTIARADAALIDAQLTELYARRARLEAERDGGRVLAKARGGAELLASPAFEEKRAGQARLFKARRETRRTKISLLDERIVQQRERIGGLKAQLAALRDQISLINEDLKAVEALHARGYAPTTRLRELKRAAKGSIGERGALTAAVAEATSVIAEARLEIERLGEADREQAIAELRDAEVAISELEERRLAARHTLQRTEVRAPQSGRVLSLSVHTVGGVVAPGEPLMEIVPEGDRLQVAARIAPQDVDKIRPGQETLVRFSAFNARRTPEAKGAVKTISADVVNDAATGAAYYRVLVDIPEGDDLAAVLSDQKLMPGMPVEAFIRTDSRPALSYLLKPLTDSMARSMREE